MSGRDVLTSIHVMFQLFKIGLSLASQMFSSNVKMCNSYFLYCKRASLMSSLSCMVCPYARYPKSIKQ
jgi:hypothetical protein